MKSRGFAYIASASNRGRALEGNRGRSPWRYSHDLGNSPKGSVPYGPPWAPASLRQSTGRYGLGGVWARLGRTLALRRGRYLGRPATALVGLVWRRRKL